MKRIIKKAYKLPISDIFITICTFLLFKIRDFRNNCKLRYVPYRRQIFVWMRNRNIQYKIISLEETLNYRKSDTLFMIGSGPSLNDVTQRQWDLIKNYDSFGINYSFLIDFIPTFHQMEYGKAEFSRNHFREVFSSRRRKYSDTIWFVSSREQRRFMHPRYVPEYFPENPTCCFYQYPDVISLESDRPFTKEDFRKAIIYRGSLSVALYLAVQMQYKNIVLMGIDLETPAHFFDNMEEMKKYVDKHYEYVKQDNINMFFHMVPKTGKYQPFDAYLFALNEYVLRPKGVYLYISKKSGLLYPKIPYYEPLERT